MKYELKKDYLTRAEGKAIIAMAMKSFRSEGMIEGISFNYLDMEETFFDSLCLTCIKDFDDKLKEEIYNNGLFENVMDSIKNAWDVYDMLYLIADKASSIDNLVNNLVKELLEKLPEEEDLKELSKNLPEEWEKVFSEYKGIINKKNEGEAK